MTDEIKRHALDSEFESGLPDDFDGKIVDVSFGYNDRYMNGEVCVATVTIRSEELDDDVEVLYPCGKGWEPSRDGSTLKHESGKPRRINKQAAWALFAYHAFDGGFTELNGDKMLDASTFKGAEFHWDIVAFDYGGEIGTRTRLMPTKFLGAGKTAKASTKATGTKAKADKPADIDADLLEAIVDAAVNAADYDSFVDAGFAIEGVEGNAAAEKLLASRKWFNEQRQS